LSWHQGERATVIGGSIVAGILLGLYLLWIPQLWDFSTLRTNEGLPLAADFSNYWAAAKLALAGKPALAYNVNDLHELQFRFLGSRHRYLTGFFYPPVFLLLVLPLGLMPYVLSFSMWIGITLLIYMVVLSRIIRHPILFPLMIVFPGTYQNFVFGQNGYLSGALLGGGLLILDRFPLVAGILFGILSYKPHFLILVLPALFFGRYWKTLICSIITSIVLCFLTLIVFGYGVWLAYFHVMALPMKALEMGTAAWIIMPTFFAATLSAGCSVKAAYLVQGVVMLAVLGGVAWVWRRKTDLALRGSVLTLGVLLFTPYAFIYDLALLALPLCWLWEDGRVRGRLPGELILLFCVWLMPVAIPFVWYGVNILHGKLQIGPVLVLALFLVALAKERRPSWTAGKIRSQSGKA
jgi:hypothetical protein